jgi:hypothetical protein
MSLKLSVYNASLIFTNNFGTKPLWNLFYDHLTNEKNEIMEITVSKWPEDENISFEMRTVWNEIAELFRRKGM